MFAGDFKIGEMERKKMSQKMLLGMALLMLISIVMIVLSMTAPYTINRWANIITAIGLFGFNLIGLPTYPYANDNF